MKKIWMLLRQFLAEDFNWKLYLSVIGFLTICIAVDFTISLETGIIDRHAGKPIRVLYFFLVYTFGYFSTSLIVFSFHKTFYHFKNWRYWTISLSALFFLALNLGFPYHSQVARFLIGNASGWYGWAYGMTNNFINLLIQTFPLFVVAWVSVTNKKEKFGLNGTNINLRPYWQVLMILLPLVMIVSFESTFRNYYPLYRRYEINALNNPTNIPEWVFAAGYELGYGLDFFNVEFLFRGVLVIGLSQLVGKEAILPMVGVYCFLHFGKPMGECISSIFGGYVLGVVAYYTRNIWGGLLVHVGLAWMMEGAAFFQRALSS